VINYLRCEKIDFVDDYHTEQTSLYQLLKLKFCFVLNAVEQNEINVISLSAHKKQVCMYMLMLS